MKDLNREGQFLKRVYCGFRRESKCYRFDNVEIISINNKNLEMEKGEEMRSFIALISSSFTWEEGNLQPAGYYKAGTDRVNCLPPIHL